MASATIDTLQIKISASATDAASALSKLATSLKNVREALGKTGKDGQSYGAKINRNLTDLQNAINKLDPEKYKKMGELTDKLSLSLAKTNIALKAIDNDGVGKLQALAAGIRDYANALKEAKAVTTGSASVSSSISKVNKALNPPTKSGQKTSSGGSSDVDGGKVTSGSKIDPEKMRAISNRIQSIVSTAQSGIAKATTWLEKFGKQITLTSGKLGNLFKSIGRIALYRAIRSALKAISQAFEEGLKNAYLYSQQTEGFERLANALDRLKSVSSQMINQIGAFWGEFKQFIKPAIEWIIEKVRQLAEFLTELFAGLNGSDKYQFAILEDLKWQEATDSLKEYKHQLLGLDELNNLTDQKRKNEEQEDATKKYELKPVRSSFQELGKTWKSITSTIEAAYQELHDLALLPVGMAALGTILLFTGHPLLGIALIMKGVQWTVEELKFNNKELKTKIEKYFKQYEKLFDTISAAALAIGIMLLFIPGKRLLGLGLILGSKMLDNLVHDKIKFSWTGLLKTIDGKFKGYLDLLSKAGKASVAIGLMLLFVPGQQLLGLGLIAAGVTLQSLAENLPNFSWDGLLETIGQKLEAYKGLFTKVGKGLVAVGTILMFVPGQLGLGLGLIMSGIVLQSVAETGMNPNWNELFDTITQKFEDFRRLIRIGSAIATAIGICLLFVPGMRGIGLSIALKGLGFLLGSSISLDFSGFGRMIEEGLSTPLEKAQAKVQGFIDELYELETAMNKDLNFDKIIGNPNLEKTQVSKEMQALIDKYGDAYVQTAIQNWENGNELDSRDIEILQQLYPKEKFEKEHSSLKFNNILSIFKRAGGGLVGQGSLFYAGEAGPEFVGSMGGNSAVANTEQMTEAIYKAAYMGMSKALQENGGGMNGFVPATTDDLFIAMRKKASNYNKMTGNSAFA